MPADSVKALATKLSAQRDIVVQHTNIPGANHFFQDKLEEMSQAVGTYVDEARKALDAVREAS